MEKNGIILVGNGPSLLDKPNGSLIDSYHKVVRFNLYNIKNHTAYTGEKTSTWFTVSNVKITPRHIDEVFFHVWSKDKLTHPYYINLQKHFKHTHIITDELLTEMRRYFKTQYGMFSTGMIAIYVMLQKRGWPQITLTGFDWWNPKYTLHHYFDSKEPQFKEVKGKGHEPTLEKSFIDSFGDRILWI